MTTTTDQHAADAIRAHHTTMQADLRQRVKDLIDAAQRGDPFADAHGAVLDYLDNELLPHASAEEQALYPAGDSGRTALLVRAMREEHTFIIARVSAFREVTDAVTAASSAAAILALFEAHLWKENELLIPALVADPNIEVGRLLEGMHQLVG